LRRNPGRRARINRAAIICAVIVAVVGAAAFAWRISHQPAAHHPVALPRPSCGSASTHFLTSDTQLLRADPGALTCFVRAARECRSASLGVTEMGVDTGTDYVFIIEPGKATCQVTEQRQDYSANFGGSQGAVSTVPCRRAAVTGSGVALRCGGRAVLIPAKVRGQSARSA
jgi:hypothetical protein